MRLIDWILRLMCGHHPAEQPERDTCAEMDQLVAERRGRFADWRHSIVDLMSLLGLDSSWDNRCRLADELGFTGDTHNSAAMNVWLIHEVMRRVADAGGRVPPELQESIAPAPNALADDRA